MYKFVINKEKCVNCGFCVDVCKSAKVYKLVNGKVEAAFKDKCWECGQCIAVCPKSAIEYDTVSDTGHITRPPDFIGNNGSLEEILRARRSVRLFNNKLPSREKIEEILDCTRWIPCAQNKCDVEWICIDDKKKIRLLCGKTVEVFRKTAQLLKNPALRQIIRIALGKDKYNQAVSNIEGFESLAERYDKGEDPIFYNAPVLIFATTPAESYFGKENSIYAGYNLMMNAAQKDLSTCRIGYFDVALERNRQLQDIVMEKDTGRKIQTTIILGYSKYKFYNLVDREPVTIKWK